MKKHSRYLRQQTLKEIGVDGQKQLLESRVLVIGAGGLGCPLLQILASTGVGYLTVVDFDRVATHNLARQMLFRNEDVGRYKTEVVTEYLKAYFPDCKVAYHTVLLHENNTSELIGTHDVVVDATDDINTRYLINDSCVLHNKPLVFAALYKFEGQLTVFNYNGGPSLRCLYPKKPQYQEIPTCEQSGMLATISSSLAQFQATEVIKVLLDLPGVLSGSLWYYDFLNHIQRSIEFKVNPVQLENIKNKRSEEEHKIHISIEELGSYEGYNWVDLRSEEETPFLPFEFIFQLPVSSDNFFEKLQNQCESTKPILFFCQSGSRAKKAQELCMNSGLHNSFALLNSIEDISTYLSAQCQ